jgi:hypothetical protein
MGGAVFERALQLQLHLAGAVTFEAYTPTFSSKCNLTNNAVGDVGGLRLSQRLFSHQYRRLIRKGIGPIDRGGSLARSQEMTAEPRVSTDRDRFGVFPHVFISWLKEVNSNKAQMGHRRVVQYLNRARNPRPRTLPDHRNAARCIRSNSWICCIP